MPQQFRQLTGMCRARLTASHAMGDMAVMSTNHYLCVYCGSGPGLDPAYMATAAALGAALAASDIGLVYGGGSLGLMGEVARTTLAGGGRVIGVIPEFLVQRERMLTEVSELIVTANMHERKMTMFEKSDGFVALPGGMGTLEELVEISTWAQLDQHAKPIILANINNYWGLLIELLAHMRKQQFIRAGLDVHFDVVGTAADIVPAFRRRLAHPRRLVIKPGAPRKL
jgi:uncharacterized protein (TIGR00730 family)